MSRKKQTIRIQIDMEKNMDYVFDRRETQLFWESKIAALIRNSGVSKEDLWIQKRI